LKRYLKNFKSNFNLKILYCHFDFTKKLKLSHLRGFTSIKKPILSFIIQKFSKLLKILKTKSVLSFVEYLKGKNHEFSNNISQTTVLFSSNFQTHLLSGTI
jgi:hypothetical protein